MWKGNVELILDANSARTICSILPSWARDSESQLAYDLWNRIASLGCGCADWVPMFLLFFSCALRPMALFVKNRFTTYITTLEVQNKKLGDQKTVKFSGSDSLKRERSPKVFLLMFSVRCLILLRRVLERTRWKRECASEKCRRAESFWTFHVGSSKRFLLRIQ